MEYRLRIEGIVVRVQRQVGELLGVQTPIAFGMPHSALHEDPFEIIQFGPESRCLGLENLAFRLAHAQLLGQFSSLPPNYFLDRGGKESSS